MSPLTIVLITAIVVVLALVVIYNGLVRTKVRVDEAWSDINVQLKRRYDLIPNLVETVKGYAKHESGVFEKVTQARTAAMNAGGMADKAKAENMLSSTLKSLFAVAEAYPDLKASQNFSQLQTDLTDTEDKIQAARRFYNGAVRDYNTKIKVFPNSLFAGLLHFSSCEFFGVEGEEQAQIEKPTDVKF